MSDTLINTRQYQNDTSLETVNIPDTVETICTYAFDGCSNLESIELPDSLETICAYAFRNCSSLKTVVIPANVTVVANYAFENCTSLETVIFKTDVENVLFSADVSALNAETETNTLDADTNVDTEIEHPRIFSIATGVFAGCTSLKDIYVTWSDGEVSGAPWCTANTNASSESASVYTATTLTTPTTLKSNITIHYNTDTSDM